MGLEEQNNLKSKLSDFQRTFDDIYGFDIIALFINNNAYHGYIENSPLEDKLITMFNYVPYDDNSKKPYQCHWMISESKLFLGYFNGEIDEKRLYTRDILPEFLGDELLYFYSDFSGVMKFSIQDIVKSTDTPDFLNELGNVLLLTIEKGMLTKIEKAENFF